MRATATAGPEQFLRTDHLVAGLRGRSIRSGAVMLTSQAIKFIVQMASAMVLGRLLAPHDFGLVGMVTAITGLVGFFKDLGLGIATVQRDHLTHAQVSTMFWINVGTSLILMVATAAIAPALARFYDEPRLLLITIVTSLGLLLSGLTVQHQALLRRQMRFTTLAVIDTAALAAGVMLAIITAWLGAGYWALVYLSLGVGLTTASAVWLVCRWRPSLPRRDKTAGGLLRFGGNLTAVEILMYLGRNVDNVLIGRYYGAGPLGQYSRAYSLLLLPFQQIVGPLASVAIPTLSRLRHEPARFRKAVLSIQQVSALIMIPLVAFMIATADWLIRIALGPQWEEAGHLFAILGFAALTEGLGSAGFCVLMTQGRTERLLQWGILNTIVTVLAIVTGLPWGPRGVAIAYSISGLLIRTPLMFWIAGTVSSVRTRDFYYAIAPFLFASTILLSVLTWFRSQATVTEPPWGLLGALAVAVPIYFGLLWLLPQGRQVLIEVRENLAFLRGQRGGHHENEHNMFGCIPEAAQSPHISEG
jgi:O-antigen/teichoic acid export membrane protein